MSARIIDGKAYAGSLGEKITSCIPALAAQSGQLPGLGMASFVTTRCWPLTCDAVLLSRNSGKCAVSRSANWDG